MYTILTSKQSGLSSLSFGMPMDSILILQARNGKDKGVYGYSVSESVGLTENGNVEMHTNRFIPDAGTVSEQQQAALCRSEDKRLAKLGLSSVWEE